MMELTIQGLCNLVEKHVPTANAYIEGAQIIVNFTNRPDVEIALLTPYAQRQLQSGYIDNDVLSELLFSIRRIANAADLKA